MTDQVTAAAFGPIIFAVSSTYNDYYQEVYIMDNERREFGFSAKEMLDRIVAEAHREPVDWDEMVARAAADNE